MKSLFALLFLAAFTVVAQPVRFYFGTYTDKSPSQGIYTGTLDPRTGQLGPIELAAPLKNPTFLALSPDGKILYSVSSTNGGSVAAFSRAGDGKLTWLNEFPSGNGGCHVAVDAAGRNVFVANYGGGSLASFSTKADGSLDQRTALILYTGSGPNHSRQEKPHLHATYLDASNHVYVCDLGTDNIWRYSLNPTNGVLTPANPPSATVAPGSGPRHLAFSKDGRFAYVNGEMGLNVTVFTHAVSDGALTAIQTVPLLPPDATTNGMTSAEIFSHPNGKWLYVSTRDVAKQGRDCITVYGVGADGKLTWTQTASAQVKVPRGFAIDPSGQWLLVGGQQDNKIAVLKIDATTGKLSATDQAAMVGAPVCVLFAP